MKAMFITPKLAKQLLEKNLPENRKLELSKVSKWVDMMKKGLWVNYHPQTYSITTDGYLADGQHRLNAIIETGLSFWCWVCTIDRAVMPTIDDGVKRTPGHAAHIAGVKHANTYAAAYSKYLNLKGGISSRNYLKISKTELIDIYFERPEYYDEKIALAYSMYSRSKLISPSTIAAYLLLFSDIDEHDAISFMTQVCTGKDIVNDSVLLLRDRLISEKSTMKKTPARILEALIIKTWNYCRTGRTVKILSFNSVDEKYPVAL